jgi:hypothetical protein
MSLPVPLGVRFYSANFSLDYWITRYVDDFQFRSTVPGGFASATLRVQFPYDAPIPVEKLTRLFTRVQIVDLRSAETVWEGRIEDPAMNSADDMWEINVLGSSVVATDISRPICYIDSKLDGWVAINGDFWNSQTDSSKNMLRSKFPAGRIFNSGASFSLWRWDRGRRTNSIVARYAITYEGTGPVLAQEVNFSLRTRLGIETGIDVVGFEELTQRHGNRVGLDFTGTSRGTVDLDVWRDAGSNYTTTATDNGIAEWTNPVVTCMRLDRNGDRILSGYDAADYIRVRHVVEDVIGRFLVKGWHHGFSHMTGDPADDTNWFNVPWSGQVRSDDVYLNTESTHEISNLYWENGANAKEILDTMMGVQTDAYWAIWESRFGATRGSTNTKFRFEWATWPESWGYLVSGEDEIQQQITGEDLANTMWMSYVYTDSEQRRIDWSLATNDTAPGRNASLDDAQITRMFFLEKEGQLDPAVDPFIAHTTADALLSQYQHPLNAGSITVRRPVQFFDEGLNNGSGGGAMVEPWLIRPGKMVRIQHELGDWDFHNFAHGDNLVSKGSVSVMYRIVSTTYNSKENSCTMELDKPLAWDTPTQIVGNAQGGLQVVKKVK